MRLFRLLAFLPLAALLCAASAFAHNAPGSAVLLDFHADRVDAELRLPLSELELSFREPLEVSPATILTHFGPRLADYVRQHLAVRSPDDRPWSLDIAAMEVALAEQPIDLVVRVQLRPPAGAPLRQFTLHSDVISHEVMNHYAIVSVRSDWNNALLGEQPELLGTLRSYAQDLVVDRTAGSPWRGFRSVLALGARHIADGTDHLLFLLVLLLPSPLLAAGRRWGQSASLRHTASQLLKIVSAFTLGHSITLALGALGWVRVPSQPIEILIAFSILVSAAHALRPIFPGRELWIAAGFGLVHGLAFASVIADFHLSPARTALAILGFNLGIELMQLAVVVLTIPWLVLLTRSPLGIVVRTVGGLFAAVAALAWMVERISGRPNFFAASVAQLAAHAIWLLAALVVLAVFAALRPRRGRTTPRPTLTDVHGA